MHRWMESDFQFDVTFKMAALMSFYTKVLLPGEWTRNISCTLMHHRQFL